MAKYRYHRTYQKNPHGGGMGDIIGLAVLGVGAYFLYEWFTSSSTTPVATVPVNTSTVPTTTSPNITINPSTSPGMSTVSPILNTVSPNPVVVITSTDPVTMANAPVSALAQTLLNQVGADGYPNDPNTTFLTIDEWNYFYQQQFGSISATQSAAIASNAGTSSSSDTLNVTAYVNALQAMLSSGISGLGSLGLQRATQELQPLLSNRPSMQNAPYGTSRPGRPFNEAFDPRRMGMGRTYLSGYQGVLRNHFGVPGMSGLGIIGEGYNINETTYGGATAYELATKYVM